MSDDDKIIKILFFGDMVGKPGRYAVRDFLEEHKEVHLLIKAMMNRYTIDQVNLAFRDAEANKNIKTVLVKG